MQIRITKIRLLPKVLVVAVIALALVSGYGLRFSQSAYASSNATKFCKAYPSFGGNPASNILNACIYGYDHHTGARGAKCDQKYPKRNGAHPVEWAACLIGYDKQKNPPPGTAPTPQSNAQTGNQPPKGDPAAQVKCVQDACDLIKKYVNPAINLFSVAFGLIAVISIILGSMQYATSEGDPQKASKAKQRIFSTIVAVVAYLFLFSFLQFLIPGGTFR